jgi:hypothetical protein
MQIQAIKDFIDKFTKETITSGTILEVDAERGADIIARGLGVEHGEGGEVKAAAPPETPPEPEPEQKAPPGDTDVVDDDTEGAETPPEVEPEPPAQPRRGRPKAT